MTRQEYTPISQRYGELKRERTLSRIDTSSRLLFMCSLPSDAIFSPQGNGTVLVEVPVHNNQ